VAGATRVAGENRDSPLPFDHYFGFVGGNGATSGAGTPGPTADSRLICGIGGISVGAGADVGCGNRET